MTMKESLYKDLEAQIKAFLNTKKQFGNLNILEVRSIRIDKVTNIPISEIEWYDGNRNEVLVYGTVSLLEKIHDGKKNCSATFMIPKLFILFKNKKFDIEGMESLCLDRF